MPIYEYHCESCGHEFEVMQKISDEPIRKCEGCGKMKAKRAISRTSFVLKGSGWYVTDYGGKNASNGASLKASASSESADKPSKKAANE
jgi:putative FmdB family regulatory protein